MNFTIHLNLFYFVLHFHLQSDSERKANEQMRIKIHVRKKNYDWTAFSISVSKRLEKDEKIVLKSYGLNFGKF